MKKKLAIFLFLFITSLIGTNFVKAGFLAGITSPIPDGVHYFTNGMTTIQLIVEDGVPVSIGNFEVYSDNSEYAGYWKYSFDYNMGYGYKTTSVYIPFSFQGKILYRLNEGNIIELKQVKNNTRRRGSSGNVYNGGGNYNSGGSGSNSSGSTYTRCTTCGGSGVCQSCGGRGGSYQDTGYYTGSGNKSWISCSSCNGNKRCFMCHGTGRY